MSDSKLPPDDFSATTPNIKLPKQDNPSYGSPPANDWEKTNYNYSPKDLQQDEWNKAPSKPSKPSSNQPDFDKTNYGGQPKDADWGMTQANIDLPGNRTNQSSKYDNPIYDDYSDKRSGYGETSVGIKLPRNEEPHYEEPKNAAPKYQEPPKKESTAETQEKNKKGGIPGWLWATAGLLGMFVFALAVLLGVYFFFLGKTGFEVVIKGAPVNSDVLVNNSFWGITDSDGTLRLKTLGAGESKKIDIKSQGWNCKVKEISPDEAKNGASVSRNAECEATGKTTDPGPANPPELSKECQNITDVETSRNCANTELDKLEKAEKEGKMYNVEQLLYAMNLYIVNFDQNKAVIRNQQDFNFIKRAAGFMKKLPQNIVIEIGGHTDSDGTDAKNEPLSEARATAVRNELVKNGINSTMLRTKGYGSKQPKAPNDTPENKFKNRRIEYKVI